MTRLAPDYFRALSRLLFVGAGAGAGAGVGVGVGAGAGVGVGAGAGAGAVTLVGSVCARDATGFKDAPLSPVAILSSVAVLTIADHRPQTAEVPITLDSCSHRLAQKSLHDGDWYL